MAATRWGKWPRKTATKGSRVVWGKEMGGVLKAGVRKVTKWLNCTPPHQHPSWDWEGAGRDAVTGAAERKVIP